MTSQYSLLAILFLQGTLIDGMKFGGLVLEISQLKESVVLLSLLIAAIISLHKLNDGLIVAGMRLGNISMHIIESEYKSLIITSISL
jgi:hypothetical protein